jgi:hypothetical protein
MRYDNKYTLTKFEVGEIVYLRLYKEYSLLGKLGRKISPKRAGPFKIIKKVG